MSLKKSYLYFINTDDLHNYFIWNYWHIFSSHNRVRPTKKKKKKVYTFKRNKEVQIQLQAKSEILRNSGTQIPAVGWAVMHWLFSLFPNTKPRQTFFQCFLPPSVISEVATGAFCDHEWRCGALSSRYSNHRWRDIHFWNVIFYRGKLWGHYAKSCLILHNHLRSK